MAKLSLSGYILVPAEDLDAIIRELPQHIWLTLNEAGCLAFDVRQNPETSNRFEVNEVFEDAAAFERHQARVRDSTWGEVSRNAQRHYTIQID